MDSEFAIRGASEHCSIASTGLCGPAHILASFVVAGALVSKKDIDITGVVIIEGNEWRHSE